ncbi:MAG: NAD(P)-dependent alcohol dehydrogenase [Hyphomonadaceae bacterium]
MSEPELMKAVVRERYGSPDVLRILDVRKPEPRDDQVLVRVRAASINDWDWQMLQGTIVNRLMEGLFRPKGRVLGCDVAGRVEAVGSSVTAFKAGDDVFGDLCESGFGALAEYVCASEHSFARKPGGLSYEEAAAIPQAGMLAVQGLIDVGQIQAGQRILVHAAGGGAGTFAVQLAKLRGAHVTALDKGEKLAMLRELGADEVIDYQREDFAKRPARYDLIVDAMTKRSPWAYMRALAPGGLYATMGGNLLIGLMLLAFAPLWRPKRMRFVMLKPNKDLVFLGGLVETGKIKAVIDSIYPLAQAAEAFRRFGSGRHKGKVIVTMA